MNNNIPTTDEGFDSSAVDFGKFSMPSAGETLNEAGKVVAQKSGKAARILALATVLGGAASCEEKTTVEPIEQVDPNALTPEQQKDFIELLSPTNPKMIEKGRVGPSIIDGQPVVSIPVSPVPNNKNFTEAFKGFMDIELRVINAKTGSYSITPIINRSSVEKILKKAEELEPGKRIYVMQIINHALSSTGVKRDLTGGLEIGDRDDNNPSTKAPSVDQLPERFTMKEFNKFLTNINYPDSFTLSKGETYRLGLAPLTVGVEFDVINYLISPVVDAQSIVNN
jgi:hypothetical protein